MKARSRILILVTGMLLASCGGSDTTVRHDDTVGRQGDLPIYNCSVLNSSADEFAPVVAGGTRVFFTSNRRQEGRTSFLSPDFRYGEAVFVTERNVEEAALKLDVRAQWSDALIYRPEVFGQVNTGTMAMDRKDNMYLSSGSYLAKGDGGADLFRVTSLEGAMSAPESLAEVNSPWWDAQPAVSPDGRWLVFASDRVEARPSVDDAGGRVPQLWISERGDEGSWGTPQPLPAPVKIVRVLRNEAS